MSPSQIHFLPEGISQTEVQRAQAEGDSLLEQKKYKSEFRPAKRTGKGETGS